MYGLCNSIKMIVLTPGQRVIEVEISIGVNKGKYILIPHITSAPSNAKLHFRLKHCHFALA